MFVLFSFNLINQFINTICSSFLKGLWSYLETILLILFIRRVCLSWSPMEGKGKIGEQTCSFSSTTRIRGYCVLCTGVAARRLNIPEVDWIVPYDLSMTLRVGNMAREAWMKEGTPCSSQSWLQLLPQFAHPCSRVSGNTYNIRWYKMIHLAGSRNLIPLRRQNWHNSMSSKQFTGNYYYMGKTDNLKSTPGLKRTWGASLTPPPW